MHWAVDIEIIRGLLGESSEDYTDEQLTGDAVLLPILQQIKERCAGILDTDDPEKRDLLKIIVARLIVADVYSIAPRISSSKLGDSSITYSSGDIDERVRTLESSAWRLLGTICPSKVASTGTLLFTLAPGGRRRT